MKIDEQIKNCEDLTISMAKLVRQMMDQAMLALLNDEKDKALFVIENDAHVNNMELEINEHAIQILSLLQPVASDLRSVVVSIKIANDLERIGDYAKNIARFVIKNQSFPEELKADAEEILGYFFENYDAMIKVVLQSDITMAYQVADMDEKMDEAFKRLVDKIDKSLNEKMRISVSTIALLRNIERAGDHTKNICEHVIYKVKAQYVDFG